MYYIHTNFAGDPIRAYLVNPGTENPEETLKGAKKVTQAPIKNLYRYDTEMEAAMKVIKKNTVFGVGFMLKDQEKYYIQIFEKEKRPLKDYTLLAIHENFHVFQHQLNQSQEPTQEQKDKAIEVVGVVNDFDAYPISEELLKYQILEFRISERLPQEQSSEQLKNYLKMFVAARTAEMAVDTTTTGDNKVRFMTNFQERSEGSANFVEYFSAKKAFDDFDHTRNFNQANANINIETIKSKGEIKNYFGWYIWYITGASALYMMKKSGIPYLLDFKLEGSDSDDYLTSPFGISEAHLKMTPEDLERALEQAKIEFDWEAITKEAARLGAIYNEK